MNQLRTSWKICALFLCLFGAVKFGCWQNSFDAGFWMGVVLFLPVAIACGLTEKRKES